MMLDHYTPTKYLLVRYSDKALGFSIQAEPPAPKGHPTLLPAILLAYRRI